MPTLTIRNLPADVVDRIKAAATRNRRSMEQEVRELLQHKYAERSVLTRRIRDRWQELPSTSANQVETWRETGRDSG